MFDLCYAFAYPCWKVKCFFVDYKVRIGVCLLGDIVVLVIWWSFHQAVRAVAIAGFLKQVWCVMEQPINGKTEIWISLHNFCSMSIQVLSDWLVLVHLCMYWSWLGASRPPWDLDLCRVASFSSRYNWVLRIDIWYNWVQGFKPGGWGLYRDHWEEIIQ